MLLDRQSKINLYSLTLVLPKDKWPIVSEKRNFISCHNLDKWKLIFKIFPLSCVNETHLISTALLHYTRCYFHYFDPGRVWSIVMSISVCVSLSAHITRKPHSQQSPNFVHVAYGHGLVLLWCHCNMLRTSGFVDDVMFSHNRPMQAASCVFLSSDRTWEAQLLRFQQNFAQW